MRRWIKDIIGRWQIERIRTKKLRDDYRKIERNQETLDNGGTI